MKRLLLLLLVCCTVFSFCIPVSAAEYSGYSNWFTPSLHEMQELGLIPESFSGMDLSKSITRKEMCELAVHALEIITGYAIEPEQDDYFDDTDLDYILKAYELGIVDGYPDGTFRPDAYLTRQEFFQIIENFCHAAAFLPEADSSYLQDFTDSEEVAEWAREAAQICVRYGYVNGVGSNGSVSLVPDGNASRQEAMAMFLRAFKSLNEYYYYIKNANVVVEEDKERNDRETGFDTVVENVKITGVDMQMMVATSSLNVRSNWSSDSEILGSVRYGTDLTVTGLCENGWVQVQYKGETAYVSGDYVVEYEEYDNTASDEAIDIANYALEYLGYPYIYGAESPDMGFDCSGLVYYVFGEYGYKLNRVADDQMNNGFAVSSEDLQVGDLVFFGSGSYANHVGIYIGNNNFVHAANPSSGVRISSMFETYYASRYIGARRVVTD